MDRYVEWMRLTNHGKKRVPAEELEKIGVRRVEEPTWLPMTDEFRAEIKRLYEAAVAET